MYNYCVVCGKRVRFWHRKGVNSSWHKLCWKGWKQGYDCAHKFSRDECSIHKVKDPWELYRHRMINRFLPVRQNRG